MPSITFYRGNGACSFPLHALLRELKIPFETVLMRYRPAGWESADGTISNEAYKNIHPAGYVPCFVVDGQVLTENPAILTYVALMAPERNLVGASQMERTRVIEWMTYFTGWLHGYGYGMLFKPSRFTDDRALDEDIRERGKGLIRTAYARIEKHLGGRHFFVGEADTTADYYSIIFWYWGQKNGFEMKTKYPNYTRLVGRMELKESVRAAAKEEEVPLSTAEEVRL